MSVEERQQFLKNAERWKNSWRPSDRQKWKDLVEDLSSVPPSPLGTQIKPICAIAMEAAPR